MPKNNGKQSIDKSDKKESTRLGDKTCFDDVLSEGGTNFYRSQIRDLEEQLEKYQHKCDELEVQQKDFTSRYCTIEKEKKDIVLYLKRSLAQKENELTYLSESLVGLQQAKDAEKESSELQLNQLRKEFQEKQDKVTSENKVLAGKIAALDEFRVQKEQMIGLLQGLEEQLEKQSQEHKKVTDSLEKKAVLDNDRLKNEMQQHVAAVAAEFRRLSDKNIPETTMRAIHENLSVTAQLSQLSERCKELLEENDDLRKTEKQTRREKEISQDLLNHMTRKSVSNEKVIGLLTEKCQQMQSELEEHRRAQEDHQNCQKDHVSLLAELDALRHSQASVLEESRKNHAEADRLGAELQEQKEVRGNLETILHTVAFTLKQALKEVPEEEDSEVEKMFRKNQMMQKLLAVLESAPLLGTNFIPDEESSNQLKTSPGTESTIPQVSHYKTGDLGLVPRQTLNYSKILSKIGPLSKSTRFQLHRKALSPQKKTSSLKLSGQDSISPGLGKPL
ncbi:hypothetical protein UPYG_G00187190 [Umbra pygmaea]|uniref:Cilia- and flagella-associated protein 157 n=1 Tax=Umbra pygmaea TaxID=75934 RepID=A0ABD0WS04_UMBPY